MRRTRSLLVLPITVGLVTTLAWTLASPVSALSYRQRDWATGPNGLDTARVRIIWDSNIVDADTIYYFNAGNANNFNYDDVEARIAIIRNNGDFFRYDDCFVAPELGPCQFKDPIGNVSGTQKYVTQFYLRSRAQDILYSPEIFV